MYQRHLRRTLIAALLGAPLLTATVHAQDVAANYPNRGIKIVIPYTPSGMGDSFSRILAQHLSDRLGQPVVVENRPGASQAIAAEAVAKAAPDGYTLMLGTQSGLVLNPLTKKVLPFDPVKSFAPVSMLYQMPIFLVVHPSVQATTVPELIALAKSHPKKLSFGSLGKGTSSHLAGEMFSTMAGIELTHVPYKGTSQATVDLLAGRISMMFEGGVSALPNVKDGKLKLLASTGLKRNDDVMPGLPTVNETLPGYQRTSWFGLFAPASTPRAIVDKLNREVQSIVKLPQVQKRFAGTGVEIGSSTPEQLAERLGADLESFAKILADAGMAPQ